MEQIDENIWRAITWGGLNEFLFNEKDENLDRFRSNYAYRGVYKEYEPITTSIQRMGRRPSDFESHILRNFIKYTPLNLLTGENNNIWNWMSIGQHYGLPTRLLDWTFSPNVALHFMADFEKGFKDDGVIWMVNFIEMRELMPEILKDKIMNKRHLTFTPNELTSAIGPDFESVEEFKKEHGDFLLFIEPPSIDDRIINQFALFSLMLDPNSNMTHFLEKNPSLYKKIIIPANLKWEIRDKLDQANVTERIIYPGLEGISKWIKRWYSQKSEVDRWELSDCTVDKVKKYQQIIETLLEEYAAQMGQATADSPESQVVADHKRHHYQLFTIGWEGTRHVQFPVFHFDIREGKVWIQVNNTDMLIGQELINRGIPKSDIVLGLQHPLMREDSGFAVA